MAEVSRRELLLGATALAIAPPAIAAKAAPMTATEMVEIQKQYFVTTPRYFYFSDAVRMIEWTDTGDATEWPAAGVVFEKKRLRY